MLAELEKEPPVLENTLSLVKDVLLRKKGMDDVGVDGVRMGAENANLGYKRQPKSFSNVTPTCQELVTIRTKSTKPKAPYSTEEIFSVRGESDEFFKMQKDFALENSAANWPMFKCVLKAKYF